MENEDIIVKIILNKINDLYYSNKKKYGDYKAFGQFDGLFLEIKRSQDYTNMNEIANDYLLEIKNQIDSHKQIFYAYGSVNKKELDEFQKEYIYQFITFIDIQEVCDNIKEIHNKLNGSKYMLLKTFDKHSYILILRCNKLIDGISYISSIADNEPWNLCYTILSMDQNIDLKKIELEQINVMLNFKIRSKNKFDSLKNILISKLKGADLKYQENYFLGNSDYSIGIFGISSQLFFGLFYNKEILDRENSNLCDAVKFSHSSLSLSEIPDLNVNSSNTTIELSKIQQNYKKNIDLLCNKEILLRDIYNNEPAKSSFVSKNSNKEIIECVNVFLKISYLLKDINVYDINSRYLIQMILPALYECAVQLQFEKSVSYENTYEALEEIHRSITTLLGTGIDSQHSFYTVPVLYYTPARLITFYSNFIRKLRNTFYDDKIRYEFLITPILHSIVDVKSFTPERDDYDHRLLSVHMPVSSLFDIETSLVILTHEVGHFIPDSNLRCRKDRVLCLIQSLTYIIYIDLISLEGIGAGDVFSNDMKKIISLFIKNIKTDVISKINSSKSKHKYYLKECEELIRSNIVLFLEENKNVILNNITLKDNSTYTKEDVYLSMERQFNNFLNPNDKYSVYWMNLNMERILRECYSDIFSINVLGLSCQDYINAIEDSYQGGEIFFSCFTLTRIAFVIRVFKWTEEIHKTNMNIYDKNRLFEILNIFNLNNKQSIMFDDNTIFLPGFHNYNIYTKFEKYFLNCNTILKSMLEDKEKYGWIENLYKEIKRKTNKINELMDYINNFNNNIDLLSSMKAVHDALEKINEDDLKKLVK